MNHLLQLSATDKELFDMLMSTKQRFSQATLLDIAKSRGIFYSRHDERESLALKVSLLTQNRKQLKALLDQRETVHRAERVTHFALPIALTPEQMKAVALEYQSEAPPGERVKCTPNGKNGYSVSVQYTDIDYSKTRLIQRKEKEAEIEFVVEKDQTIVRLPANEKAMDIARKLKERIDRKRTKNLSSSSVDMSDIIDPEHRSRFFTSLISEMPGFAVRTVTNLQVQKRKRSDSQIDSEDDIDDRESDRKRMLAVVQSVSFRGQGLIASEEFQQFLRRGYYISSIVWQAEMRKSPYHLVELEAGFDNPRLCKGFRYKIRAVFHTKKKDEYSKTSASLEESDRVAWLGVIETTAHVVLNKIRQAVNEDE